jgi:hypothetical protein
MPLIKLEDAKGFVFDLRPSKPDDIAIDAVIQHFGQKTVDNINKTLHRSKMSYDDLMDDLRKYDVDYAPSSLRDDKVYQLAFASVYDEFVKGDKLIPLTLGAAKANPDMPGQKSPGLPYKDLGFKTKREVFQDNEQWKDIAGTWQRIGGGVHTCLPDVALFARAQIASLDKQKIRATWGYPASVYIEEARFFYPYLDFIKNGGFDLPIGYQVEMANGGMRYIDQMLHAHPHDTYVMGDWSSFDKTVPPWLIRDAFSIIAAKIDFGRVRDSENKTWRVNSIRTRRRWKKMISYFINTPVRTCKGHRFQKTGGVPSGSCWTNIVDTLVNVIVTRFVVYHTTGRFPNAGMYLGDDSVLCLSGIVDLENIAKLAKDSFGMILNVAKSYTTTNSKNVHFLGYFNMQGHPLKAQDFLIASFMYPEHKPSDPTVTAGRAVGQMYSCFDPQWAGVWRKVIETICQDAGISIKDVEHEVNTNTFRYKYLAQTGVDPRTVTIPPPDRFIWRVLPKPTCKREYRKRHWQYAEISVKAETLFLDGLHQDSRKTESSG